MKKFLNKSHSLKKISTVLLLFVFTLGITPRKTLHDWFANHKDSTTSIPESKTPQLTKAGFNCNCENLVAESHFVTFSSVPVFNFSFIHLFAFCHTPSLVSLSLFHNNLRGPPLEF